MMNADGKQARSNPLRIVVWGLAALALLTPWVAMQFTSEVNWDHTDFVVFGIMLLVVCGAYELATRLSGDRAYRLGVGIALLGAFFMVWANLAVGIIGNEDNPVNRVFYGILAVGVIGALLARFEARGMARALVATAIAQVLVSVIALVAGWGQVFVMTGIFLAIWLTAAQLFRKAADASSHETSG